MQVQLPNNHLLVSVPKDAENFRKAFSEFCHPTLLYEIFETNLQVKVFDFDFEILGTVTKDNISFDCEVVVESFYDFDGIKGWYDYPDKKMVWNTAEQSFRSLLQSLDVYFVNTLGEEPSCINNDVWYSYERWQDAQSKVIDKVVILKRKVNVSAVR
jgi:hypothetical protein